ncbi:hypothetical protein FJR48_01800 [Sulfurimonas lithotrophica]|uniref:Uncharacterized protein n=1 Tax=Sulfurimonas lithotrophica TaxID=2590022 RepID=A0A5P8NYN4_9BACT|nr:hypothetical protein [Sulfurimonas lithotrophica]QFR48526.1 hypothetical protein FJR48_01800 [Sulfurimonas lithotrophica]
MEFFKKYQTIIFRSLGVLLLIVSIAAFFWTAPKKGFTENEIAAANVARMEARMAGQNSGVAQKEKPKHSPFLKTYKDTQAKQLRYALIVMMIAGIGFLGYSFLSKKEEQ